MKNSISKKLHVENFFISNKKEFPATWIWEEDGKGLYYLEATTKRKRYGIIKSCLYCKRNFLVRNDWIKKTSTCSKFCASKMNENKESLACSFCKKNIEKKSSSLKNSKHGLHFCDRKCKEKAQQIGGISKLHPDHYKDGAASYSVRAYRHYGESCCDCGLKFTPLLSVHHKDGNRANGDINNLEVLCSIHHDIRHMKFDKNEWIFDTKCLTPRDKLDELRKLLK